MPAPDAPLFEYRLHPPFVPPERLGLKPTPSGPPLVVRFCADGSVLLGIGTDMRRINGSRLSELFELAAEHMRGPTTSQPDRVRAALARIATGNPEHEEYADLELR